MKPRVVSILCACLAFATSAAAQQAPPVAIRPQGSAPATLEIPSALGSQEKAVPAPAPTLEPSEPVLVIPQASRDFVGRWGGHVALVNVYGRIRPPSETIVSLAFGERNDQVFMRTTVFGGPNANVLKTDAKVLNPHEVVLTLVGLDISTRPPIRHVEKLTLKLGANGQMKVSKLVDLYFGGYPEPVAEASYEGTLRQINRADEQALDRELIERGEVPRATINEHRAVTPPD